MKRDVASATTRAIQTEAYISPEDDTEEEGPCTCIDCRRARWWRDGKGEKPATFDHGSPIAYSATQAYTFNRWLQKRFMDTPPGRERTRAERKAAGVSVDIWCAMAEAAGLVEITDKTYTKLQVDAENDDAAPEPLEDPMDVERAIADTDIVFARNQERFYELTGQVWAKLPLHPWETADEALSPSELEISLANIDRALWQFFQLLESAGPKARSAWPGAATPAIAPEAA